MITLLVTGLLLIALGAGGGMARADGGNCAGGSCGRSAHAPYAPNVTYYAPYPIWTPKYIGAPYTDYQVVQYVTPPAESAAIIKQRIMAINAGNPALLPAPTESLPSVKPDKLPAPQK